MVERLEGQDPDRAFLRLMKTAASIGYSVEFAEFADQRNGDCTFFERRIRVRQGLSPAQSVKTLAHELAHALMHGDSYEAKRDVAELEAESVAYAVCQGFDIETSAYSFGYLATWAGGGDQARKAIADSAQRIQKVAYFILEECCDSSHNPNRP